MSISRLMQIGAAGVRIERGVIIDQTSTFTTPLQNATTSQTRADGTSWAGLANRSYDSSDFSWTQTNNPTNFSGFTAYIDWDLDQYSTREIVMVFATSGHGTVFNSRGGVRIGLVNNDNTKYFRLSRDSYNSNNANYWVSSKTETSGELTIASETSIARSNWYMGFRYNMSTGEFKGYKSYDNGSIWSEAVSGTHAAYADMTQVFVETYKRTGSGNKIALLDANSYKNYIIF